jgi:hypothetical protein
VIGEGQEAAPTPPGSLEDVANATASLLTGTAEMDAAARTSKPGEMMMLCAHLEWTQVGRPKYVLSDSAAAMLIATRPASFSAESLRAPFPAILVEVPAAFSPWSGSHPLQVLAGLVRYDDGHASLTIEAQQKNAECAATVLIARTGERFDERDFDPHNCVRPDGVPIMPAVVPRLVLNLLWYLTAHHECAVITRAGTARPGLVRAAVHRVGIPRDAMVTRAFREHAARLAKATSLRAVQGVLRHIVCGHWKRPPRGDGSKLLWIAPYPRGDLALGRVVGRTLKVAELGAAERGR